LKIKTKRVSELEIDKRTLEKRNEIKEKLKELCHSTSNIDDTLTLLESYCLIVLQSLNTINHE